MTNDPGLTVMVGRGSGAAPYALLPITSRNRQQLKHDSHPSAEECAEYVVQRL